jgi:hypothetical protein
MGKMAETEISLLGHNDMVAKLYKYIFIFMLAIYEGGSKTEHGQEVDKNSTASA